MIRGRRPSIFQVGQVRDDGTTITVTGWGLGVCAANCNCHRHPEGKHLTIFEDVTVGSLGLVRHGSPCNCCQPWTYKELAAIASWLKTIDHMPTIRPDARNAPPS